MAAAACQPRRRGRRRSPHPPRARPPGRGRRHRGGGHPRLFGQVRRQPLCGAAADRGGGRRSPAPGPHQVGPPPSGPRAPAAAPPPSPTAPARTRASRLRVICRRRQCSATGSRVGVRARNSATNSPPKRARSSLGWDHAAAAKVRPCEGCSEARVQHHSLPAGASGFPSRRSYVPVRVEALVVGRRWMLRRCSTCPGQSRPARSGYERGHGVDGCLQAPRLSLQPRHRSNSRARKNTPSSISSVNFLVLVFCWLTW